VVCLSKLWFPDSFPDLKISRLNGFAFAAPEDSGMFLNSFQSFGACCVL
jgi:hypothetical protein